MSHEPTSSGPAPAGAAATQEHWHRRLLEHRFTLFSVLTTIAILIGGIVEIVPMLLVSEAQEGQALPDPYTPLELAGRDIYVREGCYNCHSQMIRPLYSETLRYGDWSRSIEYVWDRPFQLGSRRIGPDLAREGGLRNDAWHYDHFRDPRSVQQGSIMPAYPWLLRNKLNPEDVRASVRAMARLGVPYTAEQIEQVPELLRAEGQQYVDRLAETGHTAAWDDEVIALIAYMQRLGTDFPTQEAAR